jgi:D-alanyl-D-alanine carboxypeptidase/D-alanyl-D-alanine-endopeptidase (penicillin-binding protein 4)
MMGRAAVFGLAAALSCSGTDLEHRIDALVESSAAARAFVGIHAVQLSTGKVLYRRNEDRLFLPASNMKLFTSALALLRLGSDHKFTTLLMRDSSGDLRLVGSGDPSMSGRAFPYDKDATPGPGLKAIEDLAEQAVKGGLQRIDGDVVGDDRAYPWAPYAPSWTQDDALREYGAPVSALTLNENVLTLVIRPGAHAGDVAQVLIDPPIEYYAIDNRLVTVGLKSESKIRVSRLPGSRQIELWGSVPANSPNIRESIREAIAIDDPALYAACALYEALVRRGVAISGRPVAKHRTSFDDNELSNGEAIASRTSPPLVELLQVMDKVSENLFAELMLREVGLAKRHQGTREAGLKELDALISEMGGGKDDARIEDGSGLARNAMVTPRLITRLLAFMNSLKVRDEWLSLLPIGGEDGTLRRRFADSKDGPKPGANLIRAKTGSLSRALALSGYAESKTYGRVAFSILMNDFAAPPSEVRALIDKITMTLVE